MSDFNSGLPIRSAADGADQRLHCKLVDGLNPSLMATVDSDLNLHVKPFGTDPGSLSKGLRVSELGSLTVDGLYHASNNTDPSSMGLICQERNVAAADSRQTMQPTAVRSDTSVSLDVAIHDEDGAAYTSLNPFPVAVVSATIGTGLWDYDKAVGVVKKTGTSNHDYAVSGSQLRLAAIHCCASGAMKIEIQIGTGGPLVFTTIWSDFNSTSNPKIYVPFAEDKIIADGDTLRIVRYNLDEQDQDIYSVIEGELI